MDREKYRIFTNIYYIFNNNISVKLQFFKKIFKYKVIGLLGNASFDVFILHSAFIPLFLIILSIFKIEINLNNIIYMLIFTLITWIVSVVSYVFVEKM